jgi:hypothetical protein
VRHRVEVIDRLSAARIHAVVERAGDREFVLQLEQATRVPEEAPLRWFDGDTAWHAIASLEQLDATHVSCRIEPPSTWEPTPTRRSLRANVHESRLLVRIASSSVLASGRRAHTVCLEASATGCRATWIGQPPRVGDTVDLSWEHGDGSRGAVELGWIAARVARIITRRSGTLEVCFSFETTRSTQAARIRAWHQAWLQRDHQRLDDGTAA